MKGRRWTDQEDQLLKEVVLHSISSGGTQLEAFAKIGKKIGRTPGACGFRWNAVLRQKNLKSYAEAKKLRVLSQLEKKRRPELDSFANILRILKHLEKDWCSLQENVEHLTLQLQQKKDRIQQLLDENKRLKEEQNSYLYYEKEVKEQYQHLVSMIKQLGREAHFLNKTPEIKERPMINDDTSTKSST
ncbi:hypothetical protein [Thermoflavimicrobium daqui]|nr:hypothetical protein [Thermoflavimicrobium daqui]